MILRTEYPVALDSPDHREPWGSVRDNTHCLAFVERCEDLFPDHPLHVLDLGCAGGGLVADFIAAGHVAVGLEGSDEPRKRGAGEWPSLGGTYLFTADCARPFTVAYPHGPGEPEVPMACDVITAWENLEHYREDELVQVLANVRKHLAPGGLFVASVATFEHEPYHRTVRPKVWWLGVFGAQGFEGAPGKFETKHMARGSGNGPMDWDADWQPQLGFHYVGRLP